MSSTTTSLRSPSPALPGAWPHTPHTPLRSRSLTCPTPTSAPNSMHLNIDDVQRKLSASPPVSPQPTSLSSDETLAPSATAGSMLSEDSQLTRYTQTLSENSMSAMTNASLDSSTSTLEGRADSASGHHKTASSNSEARIHQLPSPETSPDSHAAYTRRVRSTQQATSEDEQNPSFSSTPSQSSVSNSPLSPMVFVSPTASNRSPPAIRRLRASANESYSFSSDEDGEYDDSGLLRLGSPSLSVSLSSSPKSSPFSSPTRARIQDVSGVIVSPISENYNSSTEGLQVDSQPQLTSLSLPGSINLDESISDVIPCYSRATNANTQPDTDWTLSLTGTSEPNMSPCTTSITSPISVVAHSISPSPSLRARLENPLATHLVNFPSPSVSASPAVTFPPSPVEDDQALATNAAEYATAVMMSSWGSSGLQIEPIGIEFSRAAGSEQDSSRVTPIQERRTIASSNALKLGVLSKVKRFGTRMKHILQGKSKKRLEIEVSSRKTTSSHDVNLPTQTGDATLREQPLAVQATPPTLELELGSYNIEEHLLIPYPVSSTGNLTRLRRPRPSITADTYAISTGDNAPIISAGQVDELSGVSGSGRDGAGGSVTTVQDPASPPINSEEIQQQIEAHARPKTLEEIKNKHRLSLSAISSHLARPSSPSGSPGPSAHVAVRARRPRPASALILPSILSQSSPQSRRDVPTPNRVSISQPIGPVYHYSGMYPLPPGLDTHSPPRTRTVRLAVPANDTSSSHSHSDSRVSTIGGRNNHGLNSSSGIVRNSSPVARRRVPDVDQENNRSGRNRNQNRFSIASTLSNFAAGLVDQGSWARFDTRRESS